MLIEQRERAKALCHGWCGQFKVLNKGQWGLTEETAVEEAATTVSEK